jgi:hypothetical protein
LCGTLKKSVACWSPLLKLDGKDVLMPKKYTIYSFSDCS